MDWLFWTLPDYSEFFQLYVILPNIFAHILMPLVSFGFFCRCLQTGFKWLPALLYLVLRAGLYRMGFTLSGAGTVRLLAEICLLAFFGTAVSPGRPKNHMLPFHLSALAVSLENVCRGILQWASYLSFGFILKPRRGDFLIRMSDALRELLSVLLFLLLAALILNHFSQSIRAGIRDAFPLLMFPLLFISLVERTIQDTIYGNTVIIDSQARLLFPVINHREVFFLHLSACACLFFTLAAYRDIIASLDARQAVRQLEQQSKAQEIYIRESRLRYEKTKAFRHDTKNHLLVLGQLLKNGQSAQAYSYLEHLENALSQLSCPVHTGNAAVDALLGSKFSAAGQNHISIRCQLAIPKESGIPDYDWCILLANAVDNAVAACGPVPEKSRYLHIQGSRKGNFYLLQIENSCDPGITALPDEGIGLSNIRAVAKKHNGSVHNTVSSGAYRLEMLFILPAGKSP